MYPCVTTTFMVICNIQPVTHRKKTILKVSFSHTVVCSLPHVIFSTKVYSNELLSTTTPSGYGFNLSCQKKF